MSEEMNLYKRCKNIFKAHGVDMGGGESGIPEAPVDGKQYARKDGDWSEVVGGSGGGAMVVNFEVNLQTNTVTADKTVAEVKTAMLTMPVIGTAKAIMDETVVSYSGLGCATADNYVNPAFGCYYDSATNSWIKQIGVVDDDWAFEVEE